jgi:dTDP-4-dehydrorhamnose reductase
MSAPNGADLPVRELVPLVVGASGVVGRRVLELGGPQAVGTYHSRPFAGGVRFDAERDRLANLLAAAAGRFSHAILLFGVTRTDQCAADYQGTRRVNVDAMRAAIDDVVARGMTPVFVSSDYVFDGTRGDWRETDPASPNTAYGRQKADVEDYLHAQHGPWLIIRLSKIVDASVGGPNPLGEWVGQIKAGARIRCATDQVFSPMHVDDAALLSLRLAMAGETGIWHVAGRPYSRLALLELLLREIRAVAPLTAPDIEACRLHDLPFREKRPLNTSLATDKLRARFAFDETAMETTCRRLADANFGRAAVASGASVRS